MDEAHRVLGRHEAARVGAQRVHVRGVRQLRPQRGDREGTQAGADVGPLPEERVELPQVEPQRLREPGEPVRLGVRPVLEVAQRHGPRRSPAARGRVAAAGQDLGLAPAHGGGADDRVAQRRAGGRAQPGGGAAGGERVRRALQGGVGGRDAVDAPGRVGSRLRDVGELVPEEPVPRGRAGAGGARAEVHVAPHGDRLGVEQPGHLAGGRVAVQARLAVAGGDGGAGQRRRGVRRGDRRRRAVAGRRRGRPRAARPQRQRERRRARLGLGGAGLLRAGPLLAGLGGAGLRGRAGLHRGRGVDSGGGDPRRLPT